MKRMAEMPVEETEVGEGGLPGAEAETDACTLSGTAEHSRPDEGGEPCDDGRAGKG